MFMVDGQFDSERFVIGTMVPMQTSDGQRLNGIINNIDENTITMNFNHPLAGRDLHFTGNVIEVRDATPEELNPSAGCGCGSGGCDDSDCSSDDCGSGCNC
jgi:FKBP-type peptidyl-prolyl cis-trans isomerase SlyD